jgi:imidazolonepropionase-like amidohydrolase
MADKLGSVEVGKLADLIGTGRTEQTVTHAVCARLRWVMCVAV